MSSPISPPPPRNGIEAEARMDDESARAPEPEVVVARVLLPNDIPASSSRVDASWKAA
jgi:hypothetical protein